MNYIYIVLGSLLTGILSYISYKIYVNYKNSLNDDDYVENNEFKKNGDDKEDTLFFFYVDWCNHCQKSKPIWEQIKNNSMFNQFNINFAEIDGENKLNSRLLENYNITEYPTIVLAKKNKKYIFDANLEGETLYKFLSSVYDN